MNVHQPCRLTYFIYIIMASSSCKTYFVKSTKTLRKSLNKHVKRSDMFDRVLQFSETTTFSTCIKYNF